MNMVKSKYYKIIDITLERMVITRAEPKGKVKLLTTLRRKFSNEVKILIRLSLLFSQWTLTSKSLSETRASIIGIVCFKIETSSKEEDGGEAAEQVEE